MAGLPVQLNDINVTAGDICRAVAHHLNRAVNFKRFMDRFTAQDLVDKFAFTLADANLIKSAVADLAAVNATFQANRAFLDQLAGLGDV